MIWRREDGPEGIEDVHGRSRQEGVRHMAQEGEVTVVGQGARLEGTIVSAGSLRIDGQVKGQINADGDVMLSPQSQVEADIRAENVVVAGRFKGNITVKGKAELSRGGRIDGNITSKSLVVQEGGVFCGQSQMDQQSGSASGTSAVSAASASPGSPHDQPREGAKRDGEPAKAAAR